jgi:predicted DNA-binding antitoxin AbrB/MazE fold protein
MDERIEVVYENGVFRPVGPVPSTLRDQQHLTVLIEARETADNWLTNAAPAASLEAVRRALGKVPGTLAQIIRDEREER